MALVARTFNGASGTVDSLFDDCATADIEVVKLGVGTVGSESLIPGDATKGLSVLPTNQSASSATETNVSDTASDTQLLASNSARKFFSIWNDSSSILYVRFSGSAASATACNIKMPADSYYESGAFCYTGEIRGIWSADSTGAARICEA